MCGDRILPTHIVPLLTHQADTLKSDFQKLKNVNYKLDTVNKRRYCHDGKGKIKVMPGGRMPEKKTAGAAAYDCYARIDGKGENQYYDSDRKLHYIPRYQRMYYENAPWLCPGNA